jgi:hypothetical protein
LPTKAHILIVDNCRKQAFRIAQHTELIETHAVIGGGMYLLDLLLDHHREVRWLVEWRAAEPRHYCLRQDNYNRAGLGCHLLGSRLSIFYCAGFASGMGVNSGLQPEQKAVIALHH